MPVTTIVHVIDDDADVRQSLAFLLSTAGLAVRVHDSAIAFLEGPPRDPGRLRRDRHPHAGDGRPGAPAPLCATEGAACR